MLCVSVSGDKKNGGKKGEGREKSKKETHDTEQETRFGENPLEHELRVMRIVYHDETFGFSELFRCELPPPEKKKELIIMLSKYMGGCVGRCGVDECG